MKITSIRIGKERAKPAQVDLDSIVLLLGMRLAKAGYITNVNVLSSTSIKIGLHMRSFKIDRNVHDRNLRHNPHTGVKLTDTPTWEQRVEFNNIVNAVLNKFKVSANVKSGAFIIREGRRVFTESDWYDQKPLWVNHNESAGYYIEAVDEREFLEERRIERNKKAAERRAQAKQRVEQRPHLSLVGV